jgi:hypothetical protein
MLSEYLINASLMSTARACRDNCAEYSSVPDFIYTIAMANPENSDPEMVPAVAADELNVADSLDTNGRPKSDRQNDESQLARAERIAAARRALNGNLHAYKRVNRDNPHFVEQSQAKREQARMSSDQVYGASDIARASEIRREQPTEPGLEEFHWSRSRKDTIELFTNHPEFYIQAREDLAFSTSVELAAGGAEVSEAISELFQRYRQPENADESQLTWSEFKTQAMGVVIDFLDRAEPKVYQEFVENHVGRTSGHLEAIQPQIEHMEERFLHTMESAIETGLIPLTMHEIRSRLEDTRVLAVDTWLMQRYHRSGEYETTSDELRIEAHPESNLEDIWPTYVHEKLHALAGVTARKRTEGHLPSEDSFGDDLRLRTGVRIPKPHHVDLPRTGRFRWLDEAITERLTGSLINEDETGVYEPEQAILAILEERVPLGEFSKAYFEDFTEAEGTPAWGELQRQLNDRFEPRILLTLDKIIAATPGKGGPQAALAYLKRPK